MEDFYAACKIVIPFEKMSKVQAELIFDDTYFFQLCF